MWFVWLGSPCDPLQPLWSCNSSGSCAVSLGIGKVRVGEGRAEVGADLTLLPPFSVGNGLGGVQVALKTLLCKQCSKAKCVF